MWYLFLEGRWRTNAREYMLFWFLKQFRNLIGSEKGKKEENEKNEDWRMAFVQPYKGAS
jgi:hypothetical protein